MNYLIVDDDSCFAELLQKKILCSAQYDKQTDRIHAETKLGEVTDKKLLWADALFADIEFDDGNGITLAKRVNKLNPACRVIFVTAYPEYHSDVYDAEHQYFIAKPELDARLEAAMRKAGQTVNSLKHAKLALTFNGHTDSVEPDDIVFIEQHGRVCTIVCVGGRYAVYKKLDAILEELHSEDFYSCHKSFAVNFLHTDSFDLDAFVMDTGAKVRISRTHKSEARAAFARWCARRMRED